MSVLKTPQIQEIKCQYSKYRSQQKYLKAVKCIELLMILIDPLNEKLKQKWCLCHCRIANELWINGKFDESVIHWNKVIQKDARFGASPYYYIGVYHWFNHRLIKAKYNLEQAVRLKPNVVNYKLHLKSVLNQLQVLETPNLMKMNPKDICIRINLCFLVESGSSIIQACKYMTDLGFPIHSNEVQQCVKRGSSYWCDVYAMYTKAETE